MGSGGEIHTMVNSRRASRKPYVKGLSDPRIAPVQVAMIASRCIDRRSADFDESERQTLVRVLKVLGEEARAATLDLWPTAEICTLRAPKRGRAMRQFETTGGEQ